METLPLNPIRLPSLALAAALALAAPAFAGDVSVKLDAGTGFSIQDSTGTIERLRVDEATGNVSRNGALFVHTTGPNNLFVGAGAGSAATTGAGNTAVGFRALYSNTTGSSNSAFGYHSLHDNVSGEANSAFGDGALHDNTTGSRNTAFGTYALYGNTTGDRNLALGSRAGQYQTTGSDNIYLANTGVATESGRIRIGTDLTHTATFVAGINGSNVGGSALPVFVNPSGQLGTDGASQPAWIGGVDAAGYPASDLGNLAFEANTPNSTKTLTWTDHAGTPFSIGFLGASRESFSGAARDNLFNISQNMDASQLNVDSFFRPAWGKTTELAFHAGTATDSNSTVEDYQYVHRGQSVIEYNEATGVAPAADMFVNVRPNGGGGILANGKIASVASAPDRMTVYWYDKVGVTDPAAGDDIELPSETTLTSVSGAFDTEHQIFVSATDSCVGLDSSTAVAFAYATSVGALAGGSQVVSLIETEGPSTALAASRCVKQVANTAQTGTFTPAGTQNAVSFTNSSTDFRVSHTNIYYQDLTATHEFHVSKTLKDLNIPGIATGVTSGPNHYGWVRFLSADAISDDDTTGYRFFMGSAGNPGSLSLFGDLLLKGVGTGSVIKGWGGPGVRNFTLPDAIGDGPLAGFRTSDGGCTTGDVILAGSSTVDGYLKCGGPPVVSGSGDVVSAGPSVAGGIPIFTDASGDVIAHSGMTIVNEATTLAPSTNGPNEIRFYEDSDGDETANYITLRAVRTGTTLTGNSGIVSMTHIPRAVTSTFKRGPVIGAVSDGTTFSTPEELCDLTYFQSSGVTQACVAGTAKSFDPTTAIASWIGCWDEVPTETYFETVCTVD